METAQDFVNRYFDGTLKLNGELEAMLELRDSMIRAECADRAVAWATENVNDHNDITNPPRFDEYDAEELRAAIMGG